MKKIIMGIIAIMVAGQVQANQEQSLSLKDNKVFVTVLSDLAQTELIKTSSQKKAASSKYLGQRLQTINSYVATVPVYINVDGAVKAFKVQVSIVDRYNKSEGALKESALETIDKKIISKLNSPRAKNLLISKADKGGIVELDVEVEPIQINFPKRQEIL